MFLQFFMLVYNDVIQNKPKYLTEFFFIDQCHLFNSRQIDRHPCVDYFKVLFQKKTIREKWKFDKLLVHGIKKLIRDSRITNP